MRSIRKYKPAHADVAEENSTMVAHAGAGLPGIFAIRV